jgi:hypothetical protein
MMADRGRWFHQLLPQLRALQLLMQLEQVELLEMVLPHNRALVEQQLSQVPLLPSEAQDHLEQRELLKEVSTMERLRLQLQEDREE